MARKNYKLHEITCRFCGALNTYELPLIDTNFQGKPQPIWANDRRLRLGERSFPCYACRRLIEIAS